MNALIESTQELLRFAIAERDAFYDCSTDAEGNLTDPGDQAELDRMDQMIDRAQTALQSEEGAEQTLKLSDYPANHSLPGHYDPRFGFIKHSDPKTIFAFCPDCGSTTGQHKEGSSELDAHPAHNRGDHG